MVVGVAGVCGPVPDQAPGRVPQRPRKLSPCPPELRPRGAGQHVACGRARRARSVHHAPGRLQICQDAVDRNHGCVNVRLLDEQSPALSFKAAVLPPQCGVCHVHVRHHQGSTVIQRRRTKASQRAAPRGAAASPRELRLLVAVHDLVAHSPDDGLAGRDAHEPRQQAAPHREDALLARDLDERVEEAAVAVAPRLLLRARPSPRWVACAIWPTERTQFVELLKAEAECPKSSGVSLIGLAGSGRTCAMRRVFTTSNGPVAQGPRQAAEKPETIDCSGDSFRPSPSVFPQYSESRFALAQKRHIWLVPLRRMVGPTPFQSAKMPSWRAIVIAACTVPCEAVSRRVRSGLRTVAPAFPGRREAGTRGGTLARAHARAFLGRDDDGKTSGTRGRHGCYGRPE